MVKITSLENVKAFHHIQFKYSFVLKIDSLKSSLV